MQGSASAVAQDAIEQGSLIVTGNTGAGSNRINASSVLHGLLATNGHTPLSDEPDEDPPIEPILYRVMIDDELRRSDPPCTNLPRLTKS